MRRSMIFSAMLHVLVLVLAVVGLPQLWDTEPKVDTPVVVEMVAIDKETKAEDVQKPKPPEKKKPKKKPAKTPPPPPPEAKPAPKPPPKPVETVKEETEKVPVKKPKKKKKAKKKPKPEKKPEPEAKPKTPPRQIARARPRRRPPPSREDFLQSVLRDVAPEERAETKAEKKAPEPAPQPEPKQSKVRRAPLDAQATMTEIDAIRRQIEGCWSIPAGARNAENLVVSIRIWVNPDGKVAKAEILDRARMGSDPFFRTAAESALRAVLNPRCSPLRFPPKKYDQFKVMVLNFNPKEATGS